MYGFGFFGQALISACIALCALLVSTTAFGAEGLSVRRISVSGGTFNEAGDGLYVFAHDDSRNPDLASLSVYGWTSFGDFFGCAVSGPIVAGIVRLLPSARSGSVSVDLTQISCSGVPPSHIELHCTASDAWVSDYVSNGVSISYGIRTRYHGNTYESAAECTGVADEIVLDQSDDSGIGYLSYGQFIEN